MGPKGSLTYIDLNLAEKLRDPEFRDAFFEEISSIETADHLLREMIHVLINGADPPQTADQ